MKKNKWISGFIPMLFMSFSTGSVYCWTLFREDIEALHPAFTPQLLTLCFMLALFFLGITAAFGGKLVENSVKKASLLTFIFFTAGWLITGIAVHLGLPWLAIIGFGPIQGVGLGLGYLTPIKTLMMWFSERKGLAAGISIAAFGLAGLIGNPIIGVLLNHLPVYIVFYVLTALYGVLCFIAYIFIARPDEKGEPLLENAISVVDWDDWDKDKDISPKPVEQPPIQAAVTKDLTVKEVIFSKKFIFLWVVLFINIACGLALMSHEQQIYIMLGLNAVDDRFLIVLFCTINATANLIGRLVTASAQDRTEKKYMPYFVMTIASLVMCLIAFLIAPPILAVAFIAIFVIQFFFGCGFACLPCILEKSYGMKQLATIQGYMLTAWAIAALVGPQIATSILTLADPSTGTPAVVGTLSTLYIVLFGLFAVQLVFLFLYVNVLKKEKPQLDLQATA